MVDGMNIPEASRVFGLHRDNGRKTPSYRSRLAAAGRFHPDAPSWRPSPA